MAITALITNTRTNIVELTESFWLDTEIVSWFNWAQKDIAIRTRCLETIKSYSGVEGQARYALPTDCMKNGVGTLLHKTLYKLRNYSLREWHLMQTSGPASTGDPKGYLYVTEGTNTYFQIYPPYTASDATTTITADVSAAVTTIPITAGASFEDWGRVLIDSEVIAYDYKDTTNLYACTRGAEGTTAATHSSGATVTKRSMIMYYYRVPPDLADTNSSTVIPSEFQELMVFYATAQALFKGNQLEKGTTYMELYEDSLKDFEMEESIGALDRPSAIVDEDMMEQSEFGIV